MQFRLLLTLILLAGCLTAVGQDYNPFESIGKKAKVLTLSKGKYVEFFDMDTVQRIGSVLFNIRQKKVIKLLNTDSTFTQVSDNSSASRWYSVDPLAGAQTEWSPYHFAFDNPIRYNDPDGQYPGDFYNEQGKYAGTDGKDDNRVYVIKTTKTTNQVYGKDNYDQKGWSKPISKQAAAETESKIKAGDFSGDVMNNVVQVQPEKNMEKMIGIVSKDDGTGGTKAANNREYGGGLELGIVKESPAGSVADPAKPKPATISAPDFHSHPSGTKKVQGGSAMWNQPPSKQDITTAYRTNYVFGMRDGIIYIYNKTGVLATIPISTFKKK